MIACKYFEFIGIRNLIIRADYYQVRTIENLLIIWPEKICLLLPYKMVFYRIHRHYSIAIFFGYIVSYVDMFGLFEEIL